MVVAIIVALSRPIILAPRNLYQILFQKGPPPPLNYVTLQGVGAGLGQRYSALQGVEVEGVLSAALRNDFE